ncbi:hypothetical protein BDW74DRAFT_172617 [Aspergillus multicolor]|uniref:kinesin family protein n=1 Tax=Aspergillus multicolor TaxID=41759 RepID=UPI003CCE4585
MPIDVFTRWRPLLARSSSPSGEAEVEAQAAPSAEAEITRAHTPLSDTGRISTSITPPTHPSKAAGVRPWKSGAIFSQVFDAEGTQTPNNRTVFDTVVAPILPRVMAGETANFLAYGHSGSGKSHTMIGYDFEDEEEFGLCLAAARAIFKALTQFSALETNEQTDKLGIGLSMYELRGNTALDLLHPDHDHSNSKDKVPCHVREGPDGKTHIRGETEVFPDGRVRVRPITQRPCWTFQEFRSTLLSGLKLRATGTSTIHDQSSRTHAVLEIEIVTRTLLRARDAVIERQSELVPVAKRATDVYIEENLKGYIQDEQGKYVPHPDYTIDQSRIDEAEAKKVEFEMAVTRAEEGVEDVFSSCPHECLGGKLVFVDLAGSEFYHDKSMSTPIQCAPKAKAKPSAQEQREGRQINVDLLGLKEVIRARALGHARIPYRSSPLTMVLRWHFEGSCGMQSRTDKEKGKVKDVGYTAMILTVSPAETQFAATLNTLKYGNLVGFGVGGQTVSSR